MKVVRRENPQVKSAARGRVATGLTGATCEEDDEQTACQES